MSCERTTNQRNHCYQHLNNNQCHKPMNDTTITIPYSSIVAKEGRYFIGQGPLTVPASATSAQYGVVALTNTSTTRNIYINFITVSNKTGNSITANFYIGGIASTTPFIPQLVSNTNTSLPYTKMPKGQISYLLSTVNNPIPVTGIASFIRIVPNNETLVDEVDGRIIIGPGKSLIVLLDNLAIGTSATVVFGWWEESICVK